MKRDKSHDRTWQPVVKRDTRHELNHGPVGCRSSSTQQLGCVFQDMELPKLTSILRKSSDMQKPIQRVKFTKAIACHTKIRDQNPSLQDIFAQVNLISAAPTLQNLRIGLRRRQSGKSKVHAKQRSSVAKSVLKLKEHERSAFFSPSENRCLPASTLKPEEREFVVDSGASMYMISKKDLNSAEMDTLTKSFSPTIVMTANGEVQTYEEAIVYVKELDIFLQHASSIVARKALR